MGMDVTDWQAWIAEHLVPRRMRRWPILRRWYWQPEELAAVKERARQRAAEIQKHVGGVVMGHGEPGRPPQTWPWDKPPPKPQPKPDPKPRPK